MLLKRELERYHERCGFILEDMRIHTVFLGIPAIVKVQFIKCKPKGFLTTEPIHSCQQPYHLEVDAAL